MLKIQVLGKGLIPRGMGLAPKKTPFPADLNLIRTIISTPGLKVNFINPKTSALSPITRENSQRIWDMFNSHNGTALNAEVKSDVSVSTPNVAPITPLVTQTPAAPVVTPPVTTTPPVVTPPVEVKPPVTTPPAGAAAPVVSNTTPAVPANTTPEKPAEPAKPADNSGMLKPVNRPDDKDSKPNQSQNNDNSKK